MKIAGIDEAGRGPAIGPLIICAFASEENEQERLRKMGVKDSKLLGENARERLAKTLSKYPNEIVLITAEEITRYMDRKISLNEMEAEKAAIAIKALFKKTGKIDKVILDSPDPEPSKFARRVKKYLKAEEFRKIEIISENKADYKYPIVSAASILAKSMREAEMKRIREELEEDIGTGYSSDEKTIAYLKKHHRDTRIQKYLRHNWSTIKRLKTTDLKLSEFF